MFVLLPTIFLQYRYYGTVDRHNSLVDDSTGQYCLVLVHPCQIEVLLHLRHPNASSSLNWAQFGLHFFKCWISVLKISVEKKLSRAFRKAYFLVLLFNKRTVLEGIRIVFFYNYFYRHARKSQYCLIIIGMLTVFLAVSKGERKII